jgi:WD40 repeat protein
VCSASSDRSIGLWDVHTFKRHNRLNGHWEEVTCLANVGQELWSGSLDGSIRVWSKVSARSYEPITLLSLSLITGVRTCTRTWQKWSCRRMLALESPVRTMLVHDTLVWVATDHGISLFDTITTLKVRRTMRTRTSHHHPCPPLTRA